MSIAETERDTFSLLLRNALRDGVHKHVMTLFDALLQAEQRDAMAPGRFRTGIEDCIRAYAEAVKIVDECSDESKTKQS
jgi:hypothetical protein